MFDLLIKNANLPDGTHNVDIAISEGIFKAVENGLDAPARTTIEASGRLATVCTHLFSPPPNTPLCVSSWF